jgi:L-aminopeptidase/D-esterase-like protein
VITDITGLRVGHWTDPAARTGCTALLFPDGTVASADVRGGAPATRELELLDPRRTVSRIDAVVLTGGSAFGLAAADGVMRFCEERGQGFATPAGPVPIVVALALFDLGVGDPRARPGPDEGYAACLAATDRPVELGAVGAGAGATVAKFHRAGDSRPGGLVSAGAEGGGLRVAALVAVNASGDPGADDRTALAIAGAHDVAAPRVTGTGFGNTTIGVVATSARLDKMGCHLVAQGAHDGLARALFPAHTRGDGDAFVAAATGETDADVDVVRALAVHVVAEAVRSLSV